MLISESIFFVNNCQGEFCIPHNSEQLFEWYLLLIQIINNLTSLKWNSFSAKPTLMQQDEKKVHLLWEIDMHN